MNIVVGAVLEGKITGITKFGAFVDLQNGKNGMVHISEVASTYVKDISEFLSCGQDVKVKVISISDNGKINLSIKRTIESTAPVHHSQSRRSAVGSSTDWNRKNEPASFEDMLSRFKSTSEDKMQDLKKMMDGKRGTSGKKNSSR